MANYRSGARPKVWDDAAEAAFLAQHKMTDEAGMKAMAPKARSKEYTMEGWPDSSGSKGEGRLFRRQPR